MRLVLLFIVFAVATLAWPSGVGLTTDDLAKERHRAEFLSLLPPTVPRAASGELHLNGEVVATSVKEAADVYAERMVRIDRDAAEAQQAWEDSKAQKHLEKSYEKASVGATMAHAGHFSLTEWFQGSGNPTVACNGGNGGHSSLAIEVDKKTDKEPPEKYVGIAYSDVAVAGSGTFSDYVTGEQHAYDVPVFYAGNSDFFCYEVRYGGTQYVINRPVVYGFVIGLEP